MDWFQNFYRIPQRFFFSESAMNGHPSWLTRCLIGVVFLVTTCFCRVTFYRVFNGFLESRFPRLDRFPWRPTFALVVKMSLAFYRVSTVLFFFSYPATNRGRYGSIIDRLIHFNCEFFSSPGSWLITSLLGSFPSPPLWNWSISSVPLTFDLLTLVETMHSYGPCILNGCLVSFHVFASHVTWFPQLNKSNLIPTELRFIRSRVH